MGILVFATGGRKGQTFEWSPSNFPTAKRWRFINGCCEISTDNPVAAQKDIKFLKVNLEIVTQYDQEGAAMLQELRRNGAGFVPETGSGAVPGNAQSFIPQSSATPSSSFQSDAPNTGMSAGNRTTEGDGQAAIPRIDGNRLRSVISALSPDEEQNWTAEGQPTIQILSLDFPSITRALVDTFAADLTRSVVRKAQESAAPAPA